MRFATIILTTFTLGLAPAHLSTETTTRPMTYDATLDRAVHAHPLPRHRDYPQSFDGLNAAITAQQQRDLAVYRAAHPAPPPRPRVAAPTSRRAPAPSPSSSGSSCGYAAQITATFGNAGSWAVAIAWRESRCTPTAASSTGCLGLFQLCWPMHADIERAACGRGDRAGMFDPACNIAMAWRLYQGSGTAPWRL